ncbi:MAG TPA: nuclear transport factor 2 family protein [Pyrinomonadaceae bacterium]|jgi:hypothetical protein
MRKVSLLLFALLGLATVCMGQSAPASAPPSQPDSARIKPPTATSGSGAPAKAKSSVEDMLIAREKEVWELIKKKDIQGFATYLADDQVYVTNDGVHTKAETVKSVAAGNLSELALDEWKVLMLDKDAALVTYRVTAKGMVNGQEVSGVTRESTLWAKRGGKWLAVFHQDTMVKG